MDLPINNGGSFHSYVSLPEGMHKQVPYPKFEHFSGPGRAWPLGQRPNLTTSARVSACSEYQPMCKFDEKDWSLLLKSAIRIKNSSANLRWKARFYKHMRYNLYNTWISFHETAMLIFWPSRCAPLPQLLLPVPPSEQTLRCRRGDRRGELHHPTWDSQQIWSHHLEMGIYMYYYIRVYVWIGSFFT